MSEVVVKWHKLLTPGHKQYQQFQFEFDHFVSVDVPEKYFTDTEDGIQPVLTVEGVRYISRKLEEVMNESFTSEDVEEVNVEDW